MPRCAFAVGERSFVQTDFVSIHARASLVGAGDGSAPEVRRAPASAKELSAKYLPWAIFALALLLPWPLHFLHADLGVLVVAWFGVAGLLRVGESLLDRLVWGGLGLAGLILAEGWLFSLWPWGLDPVPVGMVLLGGIAGVAAWRRRTWVIPYRVHSSDMIILLFAAGGLWATMRPFSGRDLLHRIGYATTINDRLAHFALFDAIPNVGGFTFFHQAAARQFVDTPLRWCIRRDLISCWP